MKNPSDNEKTEKLAEAIVGTYQGDTGINFIDVTNLPVRDKILKILDLLIELLFPGYTGKRNVTRDNIKFIVGDILCEVQTELAEQIELALRHECRLKDCSTGDCATMAREVTGHAIPVEVSPRRPGDAAILVASAERAERELGWERRLSDLPTIVETAWCWCREHPQGYCD